MYLFVLLSKNTFPSKNGCDTFGLFIEMKYVVGVENTAQSNALVLTTYCRNPLTNQRVSRFIHESYPGPCSSTLKYNETCTMTDKTG